MKTGPSIDLNVKLGEIYLLAASSLRQSRSCRPCLSARRTAPTHTRAWRT